MKRILLAALLALLPMTANAASCFVGASIAASASATKIEEGGTRLDVGTQALNAGPEIGCSVKFGVVHLGAIARYDFSNASARIEDAKVESPGRWMAVATLGFDLNAGANVYGLLGIAGTEIKVPTVDSSNHLGTVIGAGVALDIGQGPLSVFAEFNHVRFSDELIEGAKVVPSENVFRVGARFAFGK